MRHKSDGFTLIELIALIVVAGVLGTLVALTYSGVQAKNHNLTRKSDINIIESKLEIYYAQNNSSEYPSLVDLNSPAWRAKNMPALAAGTIKDARWSTAAKACVSASGQPTFASKPTADCYAYQVTSATGMSCNNTTVICAHYTLTALLEGGGTYVQSSLN